MSQVYSQQPNFYQRNYEQIKVVHPISSDLWEAITGEKLTPDHISRIFERSLIHIDSLHLYSFHPSSSNQTSIIAKDKQKSRLLQTELENCTAERQQSIFDSLFSDLPELIFDTCASFVLQKLCETTNSAQQSKLLHFFTADPFPYIDQQASCRVMQRFIEMTTEENVDSLYQVLKPKLIPLCHSQNGNHIIQRFVETLPKRVPEIVDIIQSEVVTLAVDNCGCRVVQKLFDNYDLDTLSPLVDKVLGEAVELATNQYGNYVIQYILTSPKKDYSSFLRQAFTGHFYEFSIHKFASNVIEKCIRNASPSQREDIFEEIIGGPDEFNEERIITMVEDQFGNYVIQRIIESGSPEQQDAVFKCVDSNYEDLKTRQYSKHVISKLRSFGFRFSD